MSTIVVGYDGSPAARAAVNYAVGRAGSDGKLVIVHTYTVSSDALGQPDRGMRMADAVSAAERVIAELPAACPSLAGVKYETDTLCSDPAEALCRIAELRKADEIVLGTRGVGRVRGLLGSVAHDVLHRATCPVVSLPARAVVDIDDRATVS